MICEMDYTALFGHTASQNEKSLTQSADRIMGIKSLLQNAIICPVKGGGADFCKRL